MRADADPEQRHAEELEGAARAAHLAACLECAILARMADDAAQVGADAQAGAVPLSAAALDAVLAAAAAPQPPAPVVQLPARRRRWAWAALAFAAALVLALVAVAASRLAERRAPPPPAPPPPAVLPIAPPPPAPAEPPTAEPPPAAPSAPVEAAPNAAPRPSAARSAEPVDTAAALFARANEARRGGRAAEALRLYDELGARFPGSREDTAARVTSGWLLLEQLGQPGAALARFDRYLAASGGGTLAQEAMAGRALALAKLGRRADELAAWRRLLEVAPGSAYAPRARERLGQADAPAPDASPSARPR